MDKSTKETETLPVEGGSLPVQPTRQIIIETDGTNIQLVKAEVGGKIELVGILQNLINHLIQAKQ